MSALDVLARCGFKSAEEVRKAAAPYKRPEAVQSPIDWHTEEDLFDFSKGNGISAGKTSSRYIDR